MKIVSVVGARPQFIKAAPVCRWLRQEHSEILVHTGQHYDDNMSAIFFDELGIPAPEYHLGVGSGSHGAQTGAMLAGIEKVLFTEQPDWVLVYGDTNSTIAGGLAASKLHIRVAHVEAGLRSFNRRMPEEINRVLTDHVSDLLLCPSQVAVENLLAEGIHKGVLMVGDVMVDALNFAVERAREHSNVLDDLGLMEKGFLLATVHRAENTDDPLRLGGILEAFGQLQEPVIFPVHPRTRNAIARLHRLDHLPVNLLLVDPLGYLDMVKLEGAARMILTDSGGVQKEAYWLSVPCVTLRDETEWVETVQVGWNALAGAEPRRIVQVVRDFQFPEEHPLLYGDGRTAPRIVQSLAEANSTRGG